MDLFGATTVVLLTFNKQTKRATHSFFPVFLIATGTSIITLTLAQCLASYFGNPGKVYMFLSSPIACVACERTELLKTEIDGRFFWWLCLSFFRTL